MNKKKALSSGELYRKYGIVIIMIILFVASAVINHNFLKPQNLLNILKQISVVTIIACGETMLIVSGMIDLSAGFLCTTSACVSGRSSCINRTFITGSSSRNCNWMRMWMGI